MPDDDTHEGRFVGRDETWHYEFVAHGRASSFWQCATDCPHPDHEVNEPLRRAAERAAKTITRRPA